MPVVPRGNSYQATVHHKGERLRKSFRTKAEAEAWEAQVKASLLRGETIGESQEVVKGSPRNILELYELTYQRYWKGAKSEKTLVLNAKKCVEALGAHVPPAAITEQRLDDMVFAFEREGIANSTINRRLSAISKMLTHAYERGFISRKPKIDRKKEPEHRIRYITPEEEETLLGFMKLTQRHDMVDIIIVGLDTGLRMSEILGLEVRDISKGMISLWKTKGFHARSIPLTDRAREVIERRATWADSSGQLFKGWTLHRVRHHWDTARSHMGLMTDPQFIPHAMRHTFCSRLVQKGVDITTISKLAGHKTITVTMRYAHLSPNNLSSAIRILEGKEDAKDLNPTTSHTPHHSGARVA